jgi:hypothetical protein
MRYISDSDFGYLCTELGIPEEKEVPLQGALNRIAERLAPLEAAARPKARRDQIERFVDHLSKAAGLLRGADPMVALHYRRAWSELLCTLLGPDAPDALYPGYGLDIRIDDSSRWLSSRELNRRGGPDVSSLIRPEVAKFIDDRLAHRVLDKILTELATSVSRLEASDVGSASDGRPPMELRNEAIAHLAGAFFRIIGREPTSTKGGEFVRFCEMAFDGIGLSTRGLETAVGRFITKCRQNQVEKL